MKTNPYTTVTHDKDTLGIISMFKNEEHILEEWISHHKLEGVSQFVLLDNGSNDRGPEIAKEMGCEVISCPKRHNQEPYLTFYASGADEAGKRAGKGVMTTDWVMPIDLDEFAYARNGFDTITDYLSSLSKKIDAVRMTFKMFGSSNNVFQPHSVIEEFVLRGEDNVALPPPQHWNYKTIFRNKPDSDMPRLIYAHAPEVLGPTIFPVAYDDSKPNKSRVRNGRQFCDKQNLFTESEKYINLNHYSIQSKENFMYVRRMKGDVNVKGWEESNIRDYSFFKDRDFRDVRDDELKDKRGSEWKFNFPDRASLFSRNGPIEEDKLNVFCYWDKGLEFMPPMLQNILFHNRQLCERFNIGFHLLCDSNITDYLDVGSEFWGLRSNHKSDYLRWYLLKDFGGAWIDTDMVLLKDLNILYGRMTSRGYDLGLNTELTMTEEERNNQGEPRELLNSCDFDNFDSEDPCVKLGCCVLLAKKSSDVMKDAAAMLKYKLSSSVPLHEIAWPELGPILCAELFQKHSRLIQVFDRGLEDPKGCNAVTWKVDKRDGVHKKNTPGWNKRQWFGDKEEMYNKAQEIINNDNCFYLPSWSIYRENNIPGDVCDFALRDERSLFYYLVQ